MSGFNGIKNADWDKIERDTVERIRWLKMVTSKLEPGSRADMVSSFLLYPSVTKLAEFKIIVDRIKTKAEEP